MLWCIIATLLCTTATAQDHINSKIIPTETALEWTLEINLQNPNVEDYTALQLDLTLPNGFTIKEGSATLTSRLSDHILVMNASAPSAYKCLVYSPTNTPISGNSGCLISMTIVAKSPLEPNYYTGTLHNIRCATQGGKETHFADHSFYMSHEVPLPTFTVTFRVDGAVYDSIDCVVGDTIPLPETPEKEGHTFVKWVGVPLYMPNANIDIEALFSVNQYLLTYKLDNRVKHREYLDYGAVIVPHKVIVGSDKVFSGWSNLPETMPAHDVVAVGSIYPVGINTLPTDDALVDVYNLQGTLVARQVTYAWLKANLTPGVYIVNNTKVVIRAIEQ